MPVVEPITVADAAVADMPTFQLYTKNIKTISLNSIFSTISHPPPFFKGSRLTNLGGPLVSHL